MQMVQIKISTNCSEKHFILSEPEILSSYAAYILMKQNFKRLDREYQEKFDYRYYYIVKRRFLREEKRKNKGKWICHYCDQEVFKSLDSNTLPNSLTIDHKNPISKGGSKIDTNNMLISCFKCNTKKRDIPYEEFIAL